MYSMLVHTRFVCMLADLSRKLPKLYLNPAIAASGMHTSHRLVPLGPRENSACPEPRKREKNSIGIPDSSRRIATLHTFSIFSLRPFSLTHLRFRLPSLSCARHWGSYLLCLTFPCHLPLSTTTHPASSAHKHQYITHIMKVFSSTCNFEYSWDEVSTANWRKYCPWNDKATHVVGVDTLSREIDPKTGIVSLAHGVP